MTENKKAYDKLKEKYTVEELADSLMIPAEITPQEEKEFAKLRLERRKAMSDKEKLLSNMLSMKYQIKSYLKQDGYEEEKRFGTVLKYYLEIVERSQKQLGEEIGIHPSRINRIIQGKERIGKSIAYRLERHSGEIIPALYWWKLMQKEVEQEILTESKEKELEKKHVINVAYTA